MGIDCNGAEIEALETLGAFDDSPLLEVGCGDGRLTARMVGRVRHLVAVDPSEPDLRMAAAGVHGVLFLKASGEQLPFAADRFETVLFTLSLHHQNSPLALREAERVLAPAGRIFVLEPTPDGEFQQLFHLFEDETVALEAAQAAIAASPLRLRQATVFEADWRFADKADFSRYMFAYHDLSRNIEMEARLFRKLGSKAAERPLVLKDRLSLLCLAS
jgi:ubiquinone/menaquinone biosynthesis C-methylase UbiE